MNCSKFAFIPIATIIKTKENREGGRTVLKDARFYLLSFFYKVLLYNIFGILSGKEVLSIEAKRPFV